MKKIVIMAGVMVTAWMLNATAADDGGGQPSPGGERPIPGGQPQGGQGKEGGKRPLPPIITALDANGDGVIDADEIANASAALKKLDKNGDGKLTRDEYLPPRPQRPAGAQHDQGGEGGARGRDDGNGGPQGGDDRKGPPAQDGENK